MAASQMVHVLSSLPTPPGPGALKDVNSLLYDFLWDGKSDKVERTEMINEGLEMIDFQRKKSEFFQEESNL